MKPDTTLPRTHAPVDPLDLTKPVWLTIYQTETRNVLGVFDGEGAEAAARMSAAHIALRTGKHVAVFGPQVAVLAPKPPVEPAAMELPLNFTA